MPYTSLLGLSLPTTGSLAGTWGDEVNNAITSLLDSAVAGTTTLSTDADVTLTTTNGAANQARSAVIRWTAGGTVTRNITAPAQSKAYIVINATSSSQSIVIRGAGPTTGVTVPAGTKALVAWNGSDFVAIAGGLVSLTTGVTGTLPVGNGGTGAATLTLNNVLLGNGTSALQAVAPGSSGNVLTSNGTTWASSAPAAAGVSSISFGSTGLTPSTATTGAVSVAGTLAVGNGGTGAATLTLNNVLLGNGTSALQAVAPGITGNVLTSNGTTWVSSTPTSGISYPGAGIPVSTGSAWSTSKASPTGTIVGTSDTQTLTNKTIDISLNTLTGVQGTLVSGTNIKTINSTSLLGAGDIVALTSGGALGTPSSGTLTNCTADGTNEVGYKNIPQNSQSTAYTLVLSDAGKHILHPSADTTARVFTIPANSSVSYPIGTAITFVNQNGAGTLSIAITTNTMRLAGAGTTGTRTLAANGVATAIKLTSTEWIISGTNLT